MSENDEDYNATSTYAIWKSLIKVDWSTRTVFDGDKLRPEFMAKSNIYIFIHHRDGSTVYITKT